MPDTALNQHNLLSRFAEALEGRHDHLIVSHSELSAAWPGNPEGTSSLKQLLEVIGAEWNADGRTLNGDYVFSPKPAPAHEHLVDGDPLGIRARLLAGSAAD
jgi:hypothetical protein